MKKAAIIARVSTAIQNFDRQLSDLKGLAKTMGYEIPDDNVYAETISGFKREAERLQLTRLMNDIRGGKKIDMIFCSEISRISRDPKAGREIIEELESYKIPVYIQNMNMKSMNDDFSRNSFFHIVLQIILEFAKTEAEFSKHRFKSGKLQGLKEGRNIGGNHVTYGYSVAPPTEANKAGKLIINEEQAKIVRKVFDMYLKGSGIMIIANYMNDNNIPTSTDSGWTTTTVNQLLKQKMYYGSRKYKGNVYDGVVPAIITKQTYDEAIRLAKDRNTVPDRNIKYLYLLKNKLFCGYCGTGYHAKYRPKKHEHYSCGRRYSLLKSRTCVACGIGISAIESIVWAMVTSGGGVFDYLKKNNKEVNKNLNDINNIELKIKSHQVELSKRNEEKNKWQRLFVTNKIDESKLNEELSRVDGSLSTLKYKIQQLKNEMQIKKDWIVRYNNISSHSNMMKDIGTDRAKINEIIKVVLDKVIITSTTTGVLCDWFIISAFMYGETTVNLSVLFNKRTFEYYDNFKAMAGIQYSDKGVLLNDMEKLIADFKKPNIGYLRSGKKVVHTGSTIIEKIPFTSLNEKDFTFLPPVKQRLKVV